MALDGAKIFDSLHRGRGNIHSQIGPVSQDAGAAEELADALGALLKLTRTHVCWNVHRVQRLFVRLPAWRNSRALLKPHYRGRERIIPNVFGRGLIEISFCRKALAQQMDLLRVLGGARPERPRQGWPAPLRSNLPVTRGRLLRAEGRIGLKRGRWIAAERTVALRLFVSLGMPSRAVARCLRRRRLINRSARVSGQRRCATLGACRRSPGGFAAALLIRRLAS